LPAPPSSALPLIAAGAPVWLMVVTAFVLNLRFIIFSAAIARGFRGVPAGALAVGAPAHRRGFAHAWRRC
jgi:predicted branched-subunit amino acid permease